MKPNLEQYLKESYEAGVIDFRIRQTVTGEGNVVFYIHPMGKDGETLDFMVKGNDLAQFNCATNRHDLLKQEREGLITLDVEGQPCTGLIDDGAVCTKCQKRFTQEEVANDFLVVQAINGEECPAA